MPIPGQDQEDIIYDPPPTHQGLVPPPPPQRKGLSSRNTDEGRPHYGCTHTVACAHKAGADAWTQQRDRSCTSRVAATTRELRILLYKTHEGDEMRSTRIDVTRLWLLM